MERVETLIKKLQEQFSQNATSEQLMLTVQMLAAELQSAGGNNNAFPGVSVTISQNTAIGTFNKTEPEPKAEEEKTYEMLQVDEAEIEAELEELRKNAEMMNKISAHNKPHIVPETEEEVPTLSQHQPKNIVAAPPAVKEEEKQEISASQSSIHDRFRQSSIDLGDTFTEVPIRDLKKAIGVNDRFLFINELFRGDESMYERSIKTINSFSILPEAEYWIQRELKVKNGWNDSDQLVKQFYQLVKRRFS